MVSRSECASGQVQTAFIAVMVISAHIAVRLKQKQVRHVCVEFLRRQKPVMEALLKETPNGLREVILNHIPQRCMLDIVGYIVIASRFELEDSRSRDKEAVYELCCQDSTSSDEEPESNDVPKNKIINDIHSSLGQVRDKLNAQYTGSEVKEYNRLLFWAFFYSLIRALMPSLFRHFSQQPRPILPLGSYVLTATGVYFSFLLNVVIYAFLLFQVLRSWWQYREQVQLWLHFESLWLFPTKPFLEDDPHAGVADMGRDGETRPLRRRSSAPVYQLFHEHEGSDPDLGNVKKFIPRWWGLRSLLVIDLVDQRASLELYSVVVLICLGWKIVGMTLDINIDGVVTSMPSEDSNTTNVLTEASKVELAAKQYIERELAADHAQGMWDTVVFSVPLILALMVAEQMNGIVRGQRRKARHLESCISDKNGGLDQVKRILAEVKQEDEDNETGDSFTRLFGCFEINRKILGIVSILLSLSGASSMKTLYDALMMS